MQSFIFINFLNDQELEIYHHIILRCERIHRILKGFHIIIRVQISPCTPKQTFWNFLYLKDAERK